MSNRKKRVWLTLVVMGTLLASVLLGLSTLGILPSHAKHALAAGVTSTDYYPPGGTDPWGTAFDSSGNVWLALPGCDPSPYCSSNTAPGRIAEFNPRTTSWLNDYQLPSGYGQPLFLTFDHSGNLWFPMPMTNTLGMFNVTTQTFQEWPVPTAASGPWGVAADSLGNIWFTEHYGNKIGSFNISTHTFKEIATPATNSIPYGITVDASNNVWFTENSDAVALIGEYTTAGKLNEYKIRTGSTTGSGLTPHLITLDPNGNVWWSEGFVARIGELKVAQAVPGTNNGVTEYSYTTSCSSCGTHTSGISVSSNGTVWFDDSLQSIFGSFSDTGTGTASVYNTPTQNSHPHDGLNVDSQNRVWFDEEFANKLALAIPPSGGTGTPTPTATTPTITPTSSPVPGTSLGTDTFQRANQSHWGTASDGQTWAGDANTVSAFSISGNTGVVSNGGGTSYNAILGPTSTDEQVVVTGSLSSFSNSNFGPVLRWTDNNNWYKAYIDGNSLVLQSRISGNFSTMNHVTFAATAGTSYTIRFQVVGTALSAKVWATGTTEPSAWMVTATNSTLTSGYCGIRILTQSGITATFTAFQATVA